MAALRALRNKSRRLRRHLAALARYHTPRRLGNLLRVEFERILKRETVRGKPYIIVLDPLNTCNLRCPLCPTGRRELPLKPGRMELDQFKGLVDPLAPWLLKIILYNWGEPFLHKDILGMIEHAHSRRVATAVSSNLNRLPEGGGEAIVRSGLDDLIVSCDGLTQETYERYRVGGSLEAVVGNLQEIAEARRRLGRSNPSIEFQFLVFRHNEHEAPELERFARGLGADEVRLCRPYLNPGDSVIEPAANPEFVRPEYLDAKSCDPEAERLDIFSLKADAEACVRAYPPPLRCFWPWRSIVINWNGQVDPCCGKNYLDSFGNLFESDFETVWNGAAYRYSRRWIAGRADGDSPRRIVCRGCPGYR